MKLDKVSFVLENCEIIEVDGKYIGDIQCKDIKEEFIRNACNSFDLIKYCNSFCIEIHNNANKEEYPFGIQDESLKFKVFDRLNNQKDITQIKLFWHDTYYKDGKGFAKQLEPITYYLNWTGDSDYINESQKTYISECGNLYIVVDENKSIENCFILEDINNNDTMKFRFSMMMLDRRMTSIC